MFKPYKIAYQLQHVKVREAKRFGLLRESVAHLLSEAARTIPHAAMIMQIDVTPLVEYAKDSESDLAASPEKARKSACSAAPSGKIFPLFSLKPMRTACTMCPA